MNRIVNNISLLLLLTISTPSCFLVSKLNHGQFTFSQNNKQRKLVFELPNGRVEEKSRIGQREAKEQFYYFDDGPVFYVARRITWQTVNQFRIEAMAKKDEKSSVFSGKDKEGLYWKEIRVDDFLIGYAYVAPEILEDYNHALGSVRIK